MKKLSDIEVIKYECKSQKQEDMHTDICKKCEFTNGINCPMQTPPEKWDMRKVKPAIKRARRKHGL